MRRLCDVRRVRISLHYYDRALVFLLAALIIETAFLIDLLGKAARLQ